MCGTRWILRASITRGNPEGTDAGIRGLEPVASALFRARAQLAK